MEVRWKNTILILFALLIALVIGVVLFANALSDLIVSAKYFRDNVIYEPSVVQTTRLVCYYTSQEPEDKTRTIKLNQVDAALCTHINIGFANIENSTIILSTELQRILKDEVPQLRVQNDKLKLLIWVGGGGVGRKEFALMVAKHDTRKVFIKSLKEMLQTYKLDGIDLDWEFPSAYNQERMHFSQLLYELKEEFKREKRDYLLSIAVAAVEGIALFAYDIREINLYADYVNLMTYDFHFYSKGTPFTGLNAPLFARDKELSILATLNIKYSINWWLSNGIEPSKLVVGLPTYGHSFTLVNALNNIIGAPAEGFGITGIEGFATYSDVCWFMTHNVGLQYFYDSKATSPYLASGTEWISYENETSIESKANYIRSLGLGGIMAFSLNTDDINNYCWPQKHLNKTTATTFPLINTMKKVLFS